MDTTQTSPKGRRMIRRDHCPTPESPWQLGLQRRRVLSAIRNAGDYGCSTSTVIRVTGMPEKTVVDAIDWLCNEGLVYSFTEELVKATIGVPVNMKLY